MKRIVFVIILSIVFLVGAVFLEAGIFPFKVYKKTLDNGFKVIVIPLPNPGLVAYYSVVRTGSRDEYEEGHTGFAHFFEHMMFRGTEKYPSTVYDSIITEMGADSNAFTSDDLTNYQLVFAKEDLERVMELESDRFRNLSYKEDDFKTESGAVLGELLKAKTSPGFLLREALHDTAFAAHTYKHTVIGFEADVRAMPFMYEYSKSFYKRYYRPENVVLLVCGDVVPEEVFQLAEKYYANWEKGYVVPKITPEPEQKAPKSKTITFKGKTLPTLAVGYKGLKFDPQSKEYVASNMLGDILFGETSELYTRLILEQQKVEDIRVDFDINRDPGLNTVIFQVKKREYTADVKKEVADTIKKYQTELMDKNKLDQLKSHLKYKFLTRLSSTYQVAASLPRFIAVSGDIDAVDQFYETLGAITPGDIQQAAAQYFIDNRKTEILMVGE
ncbi:MAG: insulinase family protein [Candidatus Aminicenantes bacterium]|nr:MAG: insulinase family protein [Candidatus Aminicenantes bacterium]